jgi:tetrahydromethanopterin S-methyltransferase subunit G
MSRPCTKREFEKFVTNDFDHLKEKVENIDIKVDAVIGEIFEQKGKLAVLVPLTMFLAGGIITVIVLVATNV